MSAVVASTAPHFLHPLISYNIAHDPHSLSDPIGPRDGRISDKHPPNSDTLVVCIKFPLKYSPEVKLLANNGVPKVWHERGVTIMMITGHHRFSHRIEAILPSTKAVIAGYSQFVKRYYSYIQYIATVEREEILTHDYFYESLRVLRLFIIIISNWFIFVFG